jgi:hypothetical protein
MKAIVKPGDKTIIKDANDMFGANRVNSDILGVWREPIHIKDLTNEEAQFAKEYFEGMGKKVELI